MKTHYELLGLSRTAGRDEIRHAFRREIARYHPDKVQHLGVEFQEIASARAAALTEAYRVLSSENERQRYDESLDTDAGEPDRGPASAAAAPAAQAAAPTPASAATANRPSAADEEETMNFIRRAVLAKVKRIAADLGGTVGAAGAFDAVVSVGGRKALFRRPEPGVRIAIRILPQVDPSAIEDSWDEAVKLGPSADTSCVMLLGRQLSSSRDLGLAVTALRSRRSSARPLIIPVDVRDWDALLPPETPVVVRGLIDRLRASV